MSRIGKKPIAIPPGVTVTETGRLLVVKGPKGELSRPVHELVTITIADGAVSVDVARKDDTFERSLWGTFGAHVRNMIHGVTMGFKKQLEINGVGYKAAMQGKDLKLEVGYSHPVIFEIPAGLKASVEKNVITLEGFDKDLIGKIAAELRAVKPPEPYKGKGLKYLEETIRRKAGKAAKAAGA